MNEAAPVIVEFFGIPRQRAGRATLAVRADTVAEALAVVERTCPEVGELLRRTPGAASHCLLSINGERFATDLSEQLQPGDHLLILSADVGG